MGVPFRVTNQHRKVGPGRRCNTTCFYRIRNLMRTEKYTQGEEVQKHMFLRNMKPHEHRKARQRGGQYLTFSQNTKSYQRREAGPMGEVQYRTSLQNTESHQHVTIRPRGYIITHFYRIQNPVSTEKYIQTGGTIPHVFKEYGITSTTRSTLNVKSHQQKEVSPRGGTTPHIFTEYEITSS